MLKGEGDMAGEVIETIKTKYVFCGASIETRIQRGRDGGLIMKEYYCKVNEAPKTDEEVAASVKVDIVAQYLLNEVCSNYDYQWENALDGDKEAFRDYAREIISKVK